MNERKDVAPEWRPGSYDGLTHLGDCVERGPDYMGYVVRLHSTAARPEEWSAYGYNHRKPGHVWLASRDSKEAAQGVLETWAGMHRTDYLCEVFPRESADSHCRNQGVMVRHPSGHSDCRLIVCQRHASVLWDWKSSYVEDFAAKHDLVQDEPIIGGRKV